MAKSLSLNHGISLSTGKATATLCPHVLSQLVHISKPLLSKANLQKFNLCCTYSQVLTLSDIATSSGREIDSHFWRGHRSSQKSSLKWPHQIQPSSACWAIWHKTLHLLFTDSARSNRILPAHYLHSWLPNLPYQQFWPTYIDPSTSLVFTKLAGVNSYTIYSPRNQFIYYPTPTNSSTLPMTSVPITVTQWLQFAAITNMPRDPPWHWSPRLLTPHPSLYLTYTSQGKYQTHSQHYNPNYQRPIPISLPQTFPTPHTICRSSSPSPCQPQPKKLFPPTLFRITSRAYLPLLPSS
jgi:hypothetical protein